REEFEAWLLEVHGLTAEWQPERNCFKEYPAHLAYQAWQASRAAVVVELPSKWNDPTNSNMQSWDSGIDDARMAIEAAGLKVAP
ncbi:hypothetical protein, partial [Pseudomonas typographi]